MLFLVCALFGLCSFWFVLFLVRALFGSCSYKISEKIINVCFNMYFFGNNRLKTHIDLCVALIEKAHHMTYML